MSGRDSSSWGKEMRWLLDHMRESRREKKDLVIPKTREEPTHFFIPAAPFFKTREESTIRSIILVSNFTEPYHYPEFFFFFFFFVTGGCISIIKSSHHKVIYLPPTPPPPQYHHSSTPSVTYSLGGQSSFQDEAVAKLQNDHCYFTLFLINTFHPSDIHFQLPAITWHTHTFTEHPHTDQNPYLFFLQGYHQKQHQRSLQGWVQSWADALATLLVKENQTKDTHQTENAENGQIFPSACFMWLYCQ